MASPLRSPQAGVLGDLPHDFRCPLSGDIMTDPVTLVETGQDFQRSAIEDWFARGLDTCPQTKVPLTSSRLAPDSELKLRVLDWLKAKRTELQLQAGRPPPEEMQLPPDDTGPPSGGKDPGQLSNLMRQGRLNELIRQASREPSGGGEAAMDAAAAAVGGRQEAPAGSGAKGVARLSINTAASGGGDDRGEGGGGYAKAPQPTTPRQSSMRPTTSDANDGRGASSSQYIRPSAAALRSPRSTDLAGPFQPKWMPDASEQPSAQQPEASAAPQHQSQQQQSDATVPDPEAQQQPPAPPPPPPPLPQQHLPQDGAPQQQQEQPHGPPPKTPSFDQWAHDNAASAHGPDGRTGGAIEPVRLPPSRHTAPESELPPAMSDSSLPQQHTDASEAPSGQPAAAMPDAPPDPELQQQASQPWVPADGSRDSSYPDAPSAAASQASEQWHSAEQPPREENVAPTAGRQPAETTELAASGSQQWQPPAAATSDASQTLQQEPDLTQQQQPQHDWQQQQQQAPHVDRSMSGASVQGDQQQQPDQQQMQRPAMSSFTPMSQFGTLRQQHQPQPQLQQQQPLQASQQSPSPHHSQQQTSHSWPTNAQPQAEQYAPQQQQQQQQQQPPPPPYVQQQQSQYAQQQHYPQQQEQQRYPQQPQQQGYPQQQQQEYPQQPQEQQQQQQHPPQQQHYPQQHEQQLGLQQYAQQPPQPQPYHEVQQSVTRKPPVQEDYAWRDPAGDHRYQHNATGYQQDTYSTTLATIAAAKERWGNTTRFPEWQPPQGAQDGGQSNTAQMSMAERAQQQQQQQPGAEQYMQAGGTTFVDRYGQREPDYSYYTGR